MVNYSGMTDEELVMKYLTKKLSPLAEDSCLVECLYEKQFEELKQILRKGIASAESTSVLVFGPRGSGKSMLVTSALRWIGEQNDLQGNYKVIELNGSVHTDDRTALKVITTELGLDGAVGSRVFGSFAENLQFLVGCLKDERQRNTAISAIFILDEFERFTQHKNQSLLYNLFDAAQSRQAPLVVIGICSRLDAVELLEKRVKSRFSHRTLNLINDLTEESYLELAGKLLRIENNILSSNLTRAWNENLQRKLPSFRGSLLKLYSLDRITRNLSKALQFLVREIGSDLELRSERLSESVKRIYEDDPKFCAILKMPALHLVLLSCLIRLNAIYDGEPLNFELLHKDYLRFLQNTKHFDVSKKIVFSAFDNICDLGLVQSIKGTHSSQKSYTIHHLHFGKYTILEAVKDRSDLPIEIAQWITHTLRDSNLCF